MTRSGNNLLLLGLLSLQQACNAPLKKEKPVYAKGTYGYAADFLKENTKRVLELSTDDGMSKILLSADYQGRVMTSTASGDSGTSFGWINYDLIGKRTKKAQFNPVGGEERFWLGPEGGQYSLYFAKGDSFNISHWQVPSVIDTIPYQVLDKDSASVTFTKEARLKNYSGTDFHFVIQRRISIIDKNKLANMFSLSIPEDVKSVAYQTTNGIKNIGTEAWTKDKGLMSIWLLGMMTPTPATVVMIPFSGGKNAKQNITDDYFGKIPADRLVVKDSVLYFQCDGKQRGKLGLSPTIAKNFAASYDFENNVLTFINFPVDKLGNYVNGKWEIQKEPYKGDVVNAYNDGPLADGSQLGPFYEIESSSSAKELGAGDIQTYQQVTCHLQGSYASMKKIVLDLLHIDLDDVKTTMKK